MSLLYTGNISVGGQELSSSGRKYVVYNKVESDPLCDSSGSISTFTFLNFLASSVSLAALLGSNSNSNNNNNNQNNNQECLSTSYNEKKSTKFLRYFSDQLSLTQVLWPILKNNNNDNNINIGNIRFYFLVVTAL